MHGRHVRRLEVDGNNLADFLVSEIEFPPAVLRDDRAGCNEEEHPRAARIRRGQLFPPLVTRTDTFVVPDVHTVVVEPGNLTENRIGILIRIAHEHERAITLVG